jgi:hypothetical protein
VAKARSLDGLDVHAARIVRRCSMLRRDSCRRSLCQVQGQTPTTSADILAAILITGIIAAAEQATRIDPTDIRAAAELTTSACQAELRGLDPQRVRSVDDADRAS